MIVTEAIPDVRSVTLGFWVGVGSRNETEEDNGMSHFIEHLLFKGTDSRSAKDISETFDALGAELNAFTTKEFTCFYTRLLDEHLPVGVEVLSDMLQNPLFKSEHVEFEREVVLEEIAMYEDTPDERVHDLFTAALWPQHPLGKQVLGTTDTVGGFDDHLTRGFFSLNYSPDNMVVAAAGHLEHDNVVDLVQRFFTKKPTGRPPHHDLTVEIEAKTEIFSKPTEQVHMCYGTAALDARHDDRFALSILENILGGGMSSRLFQKIREERGLAYAVYSYHSLFRETGNVAIYVGTRPANVNEVLSIIRAELAAIVDAGVTEDELNRAREHLKGHLVLGLESTRNRMTRLGRSELTHGQILSIDELVEKVSKVTTPDVRRLAGEIFTADRMVLTIIGPVAQEEIAFV